MEISKNNNQQAFGLKIKNNAAFKDVLNYAVESKQVRKLDGVLNTLSHTNEEDVLTIMHGKAANDVSYSNFSVGKRFVPNRTNGLEPAQASFEALVKLAELNDAVFKRLTGAPAKLKYSIQEMISKYSAK